MVFSWDLKDAAESTEQRLGLSEFQTDGMEMEKARDAKLELTDGLKTDELKRTWAAWSDGDWRGCPEDMEATMNVELIYVVDVKSDTCLLLFHF